MGGPGSGTHFLELSEDKQTVESCVGCRREGGEYVKGTHQHYTTIRTRKNTMHNINNKQYSTLLS